MTSIEVTYEQILALRAEADTKLYASDKGTSWLLECSDSDGKELRTYLDKQVFHEGSMIENPALAGFVSGVLPHCNVPVYAKEKVFQSPDYVDRSTFNGRSTGEHVIWYVAIATGSVDGNGQPLYARDPLDAKTFIAASGLTDLQAFGTAYASGDMATAFSALYAARQHPIQASYDDINFQWMTLGAEPQRIAYYDVLSSEWKADNGTVIVKYVELADAWMAQNPSTLEWDLGIYSVFGIETSRIRIIPSPGFKVAFSQVIMRSNADVNFNYDPQTGHGTMRYSGYGYATPAQGAPFPGVFKSMEDDFQYKSLNEFRSRANIQYDTDATGLMTLVVDYEKTQPLILDSLGQQYVDIYMDGDVVMTGSTMAQASFIVMKKASF
jgi:hypothetical protein